MGGKKLINMEVRIVMDELNVEGVVGGGVAGGGGGGCGRACCG